MSQIPDLEILERKAYLSYADDGLIELLLGFAILTFGIGLLIGEPTIGFIISVGFAAVWPLLKKSLTLPRLGFVKFGPERETRLKRAKVFFVVFFLFSALLGVAAMWSFENTSLWRTGPLKLFGFLPLGIIGAVALAGLAYWEQVRRYLFYSFLIPVVLIAGPLIDIEPPFYLMFLGAAIMIPGLVVLADFLRKHPRLVKGESNDAG